MAEKNDIIWTEKSKEDLFQVYDYLCVTTTEAKAYQTILGIMGKVALLADMPFLGQKEPLLAKLNGDYRRLVEGNYKIIYRFYQGVIHINRVFDTRQNPKKLG